MYKDGKALHELIKGFLSDRDLYGLLARGTSRLLRRELARKSIEVFSISWRPKSLPSVIKKLKRKSYNHLTKMTDRAGVRVVCPYANVVTSVLDTVKQLFLVKEIEDTAKRGGPSSFGYVSKHCLAKWNPHYPGPVLFEDLPAYIKYDLSNRPVEGQRKKELDSLTEQTNEATRNLLVEIQIRTILQHAWASIYRQFVYEQEPAIPESVHRRLARLAAILEESDEAFDEEVRRFKLDPAKPKKLLRIEDQVLTIAYLQKYSSEVLGLELPENEAGWALKEAKGIGIKGVTEFEELMVATLEALEAAFSSILLKHLRSLWLYVTVVVYWTKGKQTPLVPPQQQILDDYRGLVHEELFQDILQRLDSLSLWFS